MFRPGFIFISLIKSKRRGRGNGRNNLPGPDTGGERCYDGLFFFFKRNEDVQKPMPCERKRGWRIVLFLFEWGWDSSAGGREQYGFDRTGPVMVMVMVMSEEMGGFRSEANAETRRKILGDRRGLC
jgi:hypothetical protein